MQSHRPSAQGPKQTQGSVSSIGAHLCSSTLLTKLSSFRRPAWGIQNLCWQLLATQHKQFLCYINIALPHCINSRITNYSPQFRPWTTIMEKHLRSTTSYEREGVTYATFLNTWHMQKACPQSRQKHFFTLEKYQAQPEHSGFGTSLWQSSPRGRQCLCWTAGLKSSFKAAAPFSQHRLSHNTSYPKVLQVQLSESDQLSTRERGLGATPDELAWSRVCTRQRTATSNPLPPRQELSNLSWTQSGIQHLPSSRSCKIQESAVWMWVSPSKFNSVSWEHICPHRLPATMPGSAEQGEKGNVE